jgi:hypothetical protein
MRRIKAKRSTKMQRECSGDAAKFLNRLKTEDIPGGPLRADEILGETVSIQAENHYIARFNKCFLYIIDHRYGEYLPGHKPKNDDDYNLWDVTDARKIAGYWQHTHAMGGKA